MYRPSSASRPPSDMSGHTSASLGLQTVSLLCRFQACCRLVSQSLKISIDLPTTHIYTYPIYILCVCMYVYTHHTHILIYVCTHPYTCMYTFLYLECVCVHTHVHIHLYKHTHIHTFTQYLTGAIFRGTLAYTDGVCLIHSVPTS